MRRSRRLPFLRVLRIRLTARDEERLRQASRRAAEILHPLGQEAGIEILGPVPAPVYKLKNNYRYHALVKVRRPESFRRVFQALEAGPRGWRTGVQMHLDVDPVGFA